MNAVVIASDEADARAAEAVEQHHAQLAGALALKVEALAASARGGGALDPTLRTDLVAWCRAELIPHALAEEGTLYRAAAERPEARLLVEAMLAEHRVIIDLAEDVERATDAVNAAFAAAALRSVFESHLGKENDQVLPLLVAARDVSLAELLGGMHELLGVADQDRPEPCGSEREAGPTCGCHETDEAALPELDARTIPHAIRHATVFGALDAVGSGGGLVLVAPHDPLPLLAQLERRAPGAFAVEYVDRGPDVWRLRLMRKDA